MLPIFNTQDRYIPLTLDELTVVQDCPETRKPIFRNHRVDPDTVLEAIADIMFLQDECRNTQSVPDLPHWPGYHRPMASHSDPLRKAVIFLLEDDPSQEEVLNLSPNHFNFIDICVGKVPTDMCRPSELLLLFARKESADGDKIDQRAYPKEEVLRMSRMAVEIMRKKHKPNIACEDLRRAILAHDLVRNEIIEHPEKIGLLPQFAFTPPSMKP